MEPSRQSFNVEYRGKIIVEAKEDEEILYVDIGNLFLYFIVRLSSTLLRSTSSEGCPCGDSSN